MFEVYECLTSDGSKWLMATFKFKHHAYLFVEQMQKTFTRTSDGYTPVSYEITYTLRMA